jgi:PIN domain nuclease of toxin-antitoxin system
VSRLRYLLDTHTLIWLDSDLNRFSRDSLRAIEEAEQIYFSAASAWELSIKESLGKIKLTRSVSEYARQNGFLELPVTTAYTDIAARLPLHHKYPFDRMIMAQAMHEGLTLVTADRRLARYGLSILQI